MNRDNMLIEVDELLTKLDEANIRIFDATILFFRSESTPTAYEQFLQGHIRGAAFFDHQKFSDSSRDYMCWNSFWIRRCVISVPREKPQNDACTHD